MSLIIKRLLLISGLSVMMTGCHPAGYALNDSLRDDLRRYQAGFRGLMAAEPHINRKRAASENGGFNDYLATIRPKKEHTPEEILVQRPVYGRISSLFGPRRLSFEKRARQHNGIDFAAPKGTAIVASGEGRVVSTGWRGAYGRTVEIDHGEGLTTLYAHMDKYTVKPNQKVYPGTPLGVVGNTGRSTGPHLHFEVRADNKPINPLDFVGWAA